MAQVTLRERASGVKTRFFLADEGRLDVAAVLEALDAKAVKLEDGDGSSFLVLQRRPDGLSYNTFQPGQVVDVYLVRQNQTQHQRQSYPQLSGSRWVSSSRYYTLDVDWDTTYISPDLVREIDEDMKVLTKVYTWDEFKTGSLTTRGDPQVALVQYEPPSFIGSPEDEGWDGVFTSFEHNQHMKTIDSWLELPEETSFGWLGAATKSRVKKVFYGSLAIGSKNNVVLAGKGEVRNAVLGVNIYKKLTWPGLLRTHLEYLLWGVTSELPFLQLITDMHSGGQFYVCREVLNKKSVIWIVVMKDMKQVEECLREFGRSLPESVREFSGDQLIEFNSLPFRVKFPYPGASFPSVVDCLD